MKLVIEVDAKCLIYDWNQDSQSNSIIQHKIIYS